MILGDLFESNMKRLLSVIQDLSNLTDKEFIKTHGVSPARWVSQNRQVLQSVVDQYPVLQRYLPRPDAHLYPELQGYRPVPATGKKFMQREDAQTDRNARIIAAEIEDALDQGNQDIAKQKLKELIKLGYYIDSNGELQPMGMYEEEEVMENLRKWFKEKWVRFGPDGKIRGDCARGSESEGKPKCLPQSKAHALGKKGRASAAAKKRREDPNPERRGPAKNVATKVREAAGLYGPFTLTINTGERPTSRTKTKKFRREDDAILWAEDWFEDFPQYVYATAEITDSEGNVIWYSDETMASGQGVAEEELNEKQDACYHKVKSRYKVWPSAYASGALVQCRKKGAANWGTGGKKKK